MKFDRSAIAGMIAVSAAVLAGCDERVCVDRQGRRVAEQYCGHAGGHGGFLFVNGARFGGGGDPSVARGGFGGEAAAHGGGSGGE